MTPDRWLSWLKKQGVNSTCMCFYKQALIVFISQQYAENNPLLVHTLIRSLTQLTVTFREYYEIQNFFNVFYFSSPIDFTDDIHGAI